MEEETSDEDFWDDHGEVDMEEGCCVTDSDFRAQGRGNDQPGDSRQIDHQIKALT